jgi:hypothetical protein
MSITCFQCSQDNNIVEWSYSGGKVKKEFPVNIYSEKLEGFNGVVVIYLSKDKAPNNADIYNADGTLYKNIINPVSQASGSMFTDLYYVKGKLLMIINDNIYNFSCVLDSSGDIHELHETR